MYTLYNGSIQVIFHKSKVIFLNSAVVRETNMTLRVPELVFLEKFLLAPKLRKWTKKLCQKRFLNLLKNFVIIFTEFRL